MKKFVYKFETVKNVKEKLEKKIQRELAVLESQIEICKKDFNILLEEESRNKSAGKRRTKIAEINFTKGYELYMEKRKNAVLYRIKELTNQKEKKITELVQKSKEHKIFDTLEEKHREVFYEEQNKEENGVINEIAIQRFLRDQN